jgi:outer membrane protein TolC
LHLAEHLLDLAKERDAQLAERVRQGLTSEFERLDNQQNIALREGTLISAQNSFQQSAIDLSLFLRDPAGVPLIPQLDRLPTFPPPDTPDAEEFAQALEMALNQRPELQSLLLEREGLMVELRYAENLAEPGLDVVASAAQDVGDTSTSTGLFRTDRSKFDLGLRLEWPLQQRAALGKIQATRHRLAQVEARLRYATDTVRADLQGAWTALERTVEFYRQAKARVDLARRVADAERARLAGGQSTVLTVTLREQATFDAEVTAVGALFDYFTALAEYRAALGLGGPLPDTRLIAPVVE